MLNILRKFFVIYLESYLVFLRRCQLPLKKKMTIKKMLHSIIRCIEIKESKGVRLHKKTIRNKFMRR